MLLQNTYGFCDLSTRVLCHTKIVQNFYHWVLTRKYTGILFSVLTRNYSGILFLQSKRMYQSGLITAVHFILIYFIC